MSGSEYLYFNYCLPVLHDVPGAGAGRLPAEVRPVRGLGDLDGGGRAGEAGQARLERRDLGPRAAAARVDARHAELVRRAGRQLQLLGQALGVLRRICDLAPGIMRDEDFLHLPPSRFPTSPDLRWEDSSC